MNGWLIALVVWGGVFTALGAAWLFDMSAREKAGLPDNGVLWGLSILWFAAPFAPLLGLAWVLRAPIVVVYRRRGASTTRGMDGSS